MKFHNLYNINGLFLKFGRYIFKKLLVNTFMNFVFINFRIISLYFRVVSVFSISLLTYL